MFGIPAFQNVSFWHFQTSFMTTMIGRWKSIKKKVITSDQFDERNRKHTHADMHMEEGGGQQTTFAEEKKKQHGHEMICQASNDKYVSEPCHC